MKNSKYKLIVFTLSVIFLALTSCEVNEVQDPNNPTLASVTTNANKSQLQVLVTGLEARHRGYLTNVVQMFGAFGREVWPYFASDPRFINDWLGIGRTETYPDFFGSAGSYTTPYLAVKQANTLIAAADNSSYVTQQEADGYTGFAKTIKGFQLIWPLMQQWDNGIRIDVEDPLNPGPVVTRAQAIDAIRQILEEGANDLKAAGNTFAFSLTSGFTGFDTPAGMLKVNRAIAARVALYDEDWQGALTALNESFMNLNASTPEDLNVGPKHVFGVAPDATNPLFYPFDQSTSTILIAHPALIEDALPGDKRIENKFAMRTIPVQNNSLKNANGDLLLGIYQDKRWANNSAPIAFIRNEELILIYAEAQAHLGKTTEAVKAINTIRNIWMVGDYTGATDLNALIDEILFQRRYSLWAEGGHRWIDLRRTGRLNANYVDLRDRGSIYTQVARPVAEINWDKR